MAPDREIQSKVAKVLTEALGIDECEILPSTRLRGDLGAESIDFLDIIFRLEREFGIKIPRGELFPDSILGANPEFVQGGFVTDQGMAELRSYVPYADLSDFERDRSLDALADLYTVDLVVRYVDWKLSRNDQTALLNRADARVGRESQAARRP